MQQCRPEDLEAVRAIYAGAGVKAELASFFGDLPQRMAKAHLVIGRSGAGTVAELMGEFPEGARLSPRAIEMARLFEALPSERERNAVFNLARAMLL